MGGLSEQTLAVVGALEPPLDAPTKSDIVFTLRGWDGETALLLHGQVWVWIWVLTWERRERRRAENWIKVCIISFRWVSLIFIEMDKRCRVETVSQWECVFVLMLMFLCVFTSVSVEHGHIQVCSTGVDEVLFQSLTSQQIFSNRGKDERKSHTDTYKMRAQTHTQADTY